MYPDNIHHQPSAPSAPGSLPPVQVTNLGPQLSAAPQPAPASPGIPSAAAMPEEKMADRVKRLTKQYGANPFAFNAAFQQLKAQYLLERFNIDPNADKK